MYLSRFKMRMLFLLFTLLEYFALSMVHESICNSHHTCEEVHFQNPNLRNMLVQRCEKKTFFTSSTRNISFTHIPKVGGSSLNQILKKNFRDRFVRKDHQPFQIDAEQVPNDLFVTIMREPTDKAVSLFSYINQRNKLAQNLAKDDLWKKTYKVDPVKWTTSKEVLKRLREDVIMYFNPTLFFSVKKTHGKNKNASMINTGTNNTIATIQRTRHGFLPHSPLNVTLQEFMKYTQHMPPEYRCKRYIEVAWILLRNFAAVGTTEKFPKFLEILQRRTMHADANFIPNASTVHRNKSNYRKIGAANVTLLYESFRGKFFCNTVLWKIAGKINEHDLFCN